MADLKPHYVRDEVVGETAWRALVARHGGGDYLVPTALHSPGGQALAAIAGDVAAAALIDYAGGTTIYVHTAQYQALSAKCAEIRAMRDRGITVRELADRFGCSERSIARVLAAG